MSERPFIATYRLQLSHEFTFDDVIAALPFIHRLGVSHLYLSPIMEAVTGSNHGYDGTDFNRLSAERGGEAGLFRLNDQIKKLDPPLGLIFDIVPNHMAAHTENPYWRDVLQKGRKSEHYDFFDLRISPHQKIKLPILQENAKPNDLSIQWEEGGIAVLQTPAMPLPINSEGQEFLKTLGDVSPSAQQMNNLLNLQHYQLVPWTEALKEMSYRRFFDVAGLVALRMDDKAVFERTHAKLFELIDQLGTVDGLRIDHVDGLADPLIYLERLAQHGIPLWVEKILMKGEALPSHWPVAGTTGYEFTAQLNELLVMRPGYAEITSHWRAYTQAQWYDFNACQTSSKEQILEEIFQPEFSHLIEQKNAASKELWKRLTINLPVYRTYIMDEKCKSRDASYLNEVLSADDVVLIDWSHAIEWQQLTGPIMAKGVEDTAHYRYAPLASLNEVGCTPNLNAEDLTLTILNTDWPLRLKATSTHDTKRSEDARYRLHALSEMHLTWHSFIDQADLALSDQFLGAQERYFFYQAVLSIYPNSGIIDDVFIKRVAAYMQKAMREAKLKTSHLNPNQAYEEKLEQWIGFAFCQADFLKILNNFAPRLALCGACNSLSALVLKVLSPGIPDFYQGSEVWSLSLVDPDNRRPVNFNAHEEIGLISDAKSTLNMLENWKSGAIKLWLTKKLLQIRRQYIAYDCKIEHLSVSGPHAKHVIAYLLSGEHSCNRLLIVVTRYPHDLLEADQLHIPSNVWSGTYLLNVPSQAATLTNLLDNSTVDIHSQIDLTVLLKNLSVGVFKVG